MSSRTSLESLLQPRSVAVIGASRRPGSIGAALLANLLRCGFQGPVYPVNPSSPFVSSVPTYPSVSALPEAVDLAVVAVPREAVLEVARECAERGVRSLVVITAGFKETGEEGARLEAELLEITQRAGMRMVGPNCLGILNTNPEVRLNATFAPTWPPHGSVAFSSQSGALGLAILDYAAQLELGISSFLSIGNKADVSGNDLIEYWEHDEDTRVILLYVESFGNPRRFTEVARRVARRKPIVAVKSGRTPTGSQAASSHTGALAGSEAAVEAVLRSAGVIRTDTIEELFDTALLLAHQPLPRGPRVAVLTNAGGPGIMAADACESWGLKLPALAPETVARLREYLPAAASTKNPVDMIASASADHFGRSLSALLADDNVDSVLVIFVPPVVTEARDVARALVAASEPSEKPVLTCFLGTHGVPEGLRSLHAGHVPSYSFPEAAARALGRVVRYAQWRAQPEGAAPGPSGVDAAAVRRAIAGQAAEARWLEPAEVSKLLDAYGVSRPRSAVAATPAEAARAAQTMPAPYAVKLVSSRILHKSDVGGVELDVASAAEVEAAARRIAERAAGDFEGVLVQEMVPDGIEVIAGVTRDPRFGHLLMFGLGGVAVEVLQDVTFNVHPLTDRDAREMIERVRGRPLLEGYRGAPRADQEAIVDLLLRLSQMVTDLPEIEELDLNPVAVLPVGRGIRVLDARVRVAVANAAEPAALG